MLLKKISYAVHLKEIDEQYFKDPSNFPLLAFLISLQNVYKILNKTNCYILVYCVDCLSAAMKC